MEGEYLVGDESIITVDEMERSVDASARGSLTASSAFRSVNVWRRARYKYFSNLCGSHPQNSVKIFRIRRCG